MQARYEIVCVYYGLFDKESLLSTRTRRTP